MSQPIGPAATCGNCGAPDDGEVVNCTYCRRPVSAEAAARAIPCPNPACRTACRWGKQRCAACQGWIVVSCLFCGAISPHNAATCLRCNEAFAGAAQRKQQAQQAQQHQESMAAVGTWGHVAAAFAGAAVGGALGSHHTGGGYYSSSSSSSSSDAYAAPSSGDDYEASSLLDDVGDLFDE
jgi:hypothetical protein